MSLVVAIPFGVASAVVYAGSTVVQHHTAHESVEQRSAVSAAALWRLVRSPVWLLSVAGDFVGFLLQVAALATGPVVVVQPLVVLMLPVSLLLSAALGWHRPRPGEYLGLVAVVGGLAVFLALVGSPAGGRMPAAHVLTATIAVVLVAGAAVAALVSRGGTIVRAVGYGAVAGAYFGTMAVFVDAAATRWTTAGVHGLLGTAPGLVPVLGVLALGAAGIVLTQMSFQSGELDAALPASLAADPLTAVLLGVPLVGEHIALDAAHLAAYAVCLVAVVGGAVRLAGREPSAAPQPAQPTVGARSRVTPLPPGPPFR